MNPLTIYTPDPHRDLTPEEREKAWLAALLAEIERLRAAEAGKAA